MIFISSINGIIEIWILNYPTLKNINFDLVNPEYEPEELSENEPLSEESINNNSDEEVPEVACFTSRFLVKTIIHSNVPVEYPSTSQDVHQIKNSPYFGNIQVNKEERYCMGIKICQFTDPSLINTEHNKVDMESPLWKKITENQDIEYLAIKDNTCKFKNDNGIMYKWHRYIKIDPENVDITLFQNLLFEKAEKLYLIVQHYCIDYIHNLPNGKIDRGEIIQTKCPVKFYKFTPQDLTTSDVKLNLQTLIRQSINDNNIITSGNIQS
ncbi:24550_t:CDS:2, partial [Gigaspora margarita]